MDENNKIIGKIPKTTASKLIGCMRTAKGALSPQYISRTAGINYTTVNKVLAHLEETGVVECIKTTSGKKYFIPPTQKQNK